MSALFGILSAVPAKAWLVVAVVLAFLGAAGFIYLHAYDSGKQAATGEIERANDAAARKFETGTSAVDRCYDGGGRWDRSRGVCVSPGQ